MICRTASYGALAQCIGGRQSRRQRRIYVYGEPGCGQPTTRVAYFRHRCRNFVSGDTCAGDLSVEVTTSAGIIASPPISPTPAPAANAASPSHAIGGLPLGGSAGIMPVVSLDREAMARMNNWRLWARICAQRGTLLCRRLGRTLLVLLAVGVWGWAGICTQPVRMPSSSALIHRPMPNWRNRLPRSISGLASPSNPILAAFAY